MSLAIEKGAGLASLPDYMAADIYTKAFADITVEINFSFNHNL